MSKIKVSTLTGAELDYWVYRAIHGKHLADFTGGTVPYSTDWRWGGPIIDKELCSLIPYDEEKSAEGIWLFDGVYKCQFKGIGFVGEGKTILEAAMRCYVASKFGEEVNEA